MRGLPRRDRLSAILNIAIVAFVLAGVTVLFLRKVGDGKSLTAVGVKNIKYYTVQSNLLCAFVSAYYLVLKFAKKRKIPDSFVCLKLAATATISITFLVTLCILGPNYGYERLYRNQGFVFHLVVPLMAVADFWLLDTKGTRMKARYTWMSTFPTVVYGFGYIWNLVRHGLSTKFPDPNDFYKFTTYGYSVAILVFAGIIFASYLMASLFRLVNLWSNKRDKI